MCDSGQCESNCGFWSNVTSQKPCNGVFISGSNLPQHLRVRVPGQAANAATPHLGYGHLFFLSEAFVATLLRFEQIDPKKRAFSAIPFHNLTMCGREYGCYQSKANF